MTERDLEQSMKIDIKLDVFEGPLDLLLHLIEKNKVSIYDIPIVEITNQYMEYIREMEKTYSMESMSEFLVMAATLLDIKCRMLLPKEVNEEGEEEDPRPHGPAALVAPALADALAQQHRDAHGEAADHHGDGLQDLAPGGDGADVRRRAEIPHHLQIHRAVHGLQKQGQQHRQGKPRQRRQDSPLGEIVLSLHAFPTPLASAPPGRTAFSSRSPPRSGARCSRESICTRSRMR